MVAQLESQSTECLGREGQDPDGTVLIDLQLPRRATGSRREQSDTTTRLIDTKSLLQVTPYHGDKASFLGWEMVLLDCSASNQQTTL